MGDLAWFNDLAFTNFEGPIWDLTAEELAKYGMGVIGGWMYLGTVFEKCKSKGHGGLSSPNRPFTRDEITELTGETVAAALRHFRYDVLMKGKWDYRKGASLRTYFVGQCLMRFANIYRLWLRQETRHVRHPNEDEALLEFASRNHRASPADQAIDRLEVDDAISKIKKASVREAMIMTAEDMTQAEIAAALGVSEKTVERMIANQRKRFRETG
jgi:RNA polymerase sigma factor (sigma-70 family)